MFTTMVGSSTVFIRNATQEFKDEYTIANLEFEPQSADFDLIPKTKSNRGSKRKVVTFDTTTENEPTNSTFTKRLRRST
jgi:hypothetical protein